MKSILLLTKDFAADSSRCN